MWEILTVAQTWVLFLGGRFGSHHPCFERDLGCRLLGLRFRLMGPKMRASRCTRVYMSFGLNLGGGPIGDYIAFWRDLLKDILMSHFGSRSNS